MDRKLDELVLALTENMTLAVSGERLARDLAVSHSTLIRWIDKLRGAGLEIRGEPFTGFRLERLPDVMLPQWIRSRLRTRTFGRTLYHFYEVDSTNAFAARLLGHHRRVPDGTVIVAESQTAGRGRMGRIWHSAPESGLYFSMILRPRIPMAMMPLFTLAAAVAMHDAIESATRLAVDIKWPNDLLVEGRKVCGILAEAQAEIDRVHALIVGIGVNVNQSEFPEELKAKATSLRMASGRPQSRLEILAEFLDAFETLVARFEKTGPQAILEGWIARSSYANGKALRISDGFRVVEGVTCGLGASGALRMKVNDGSIYDVYSGDVEG